MASVCPKMTYTSTSGEEHPIEKIACPSCRQWAAVNKIQSVEPGKEVA
jgi:hypothetical protein